MGEKALARNGVAVIGVPRKITAKAVASMLEPLARLGMHDTDHSRTERAMASFRRTALRMLSNTINLHARRYAEGHYLAHDADYEEQDRINAAITCAIYLTDNICRLHKTVLERDDSGVSALFEKALDEVSRALSQGYYQLSIEAVARRMERAEPFLEAAMNAAGLQEHFLPSKDVYEAVKSEARDRVVASLERIKAEDPVPDPEAA